MSNTMLRERSLFSVNTVNKDLIEDENVTNLATLLHSEVKKFNESGKDRSTFDYPDYQITLTEQSSRHVAKFNYQLLKDVVLVDHKNYFEKTQRWIGHVTELGSGTFKAKIFDLGAQGSKSYELVEIDIDEVTEEDRVDLLRLGSVFYWSIGIEHRNGQKIRESLIRFQRLPFWNESEIDEAVDEAASLYESFIDTDQP